MHLSKMKKNIILIGLNHKTAPVEIREKYALSSYSPKEHNLLLNSKSLEEYLILSTCNRVEILAIGGAKDKILQELFSFWVNFCNGSLEELQQHIYIYQDLEAIRHLFTVAASLDSMVVGEPQILGQLKTAYRQAVKAHTAKVILNRLLHKSFSVAKRVRTETNIASSAVSISYAAVKLAQKIFGNLKHSVALLIGAGEMAELAALHLLNNGVKNILVANRTFERAKELAIKFKGKAVNYNNLIQTLTHVDIIISSTGAPYTILQAKEVKTILKKRKYRPMFFIDIAVPRDIDPDVNQLENVFLYDIDDLKEVVEENLASRKEEAKRASLIIEEEVEKFKIWLNSLDITPTIKELMSKGEQIAYKELYKTLKKLHLSPQEQKHIETLALSLVKKLYTDPIIFLKRRQQEEDTITKYIDALRKMFNLDEIELEQKIHSHKN
ncbi:glutamyl-tRNA reductase [Desulfonauticus submarinus]|uniref:Glutamyl-tRNA reductase n=2 Tax=Desulfonauticus submarinus TaxID=206665 RepID=A0A1H0F763_9BACT|nr:glutamyl-tRNA reductase [Desulfonauticus submarinus]